MRRSVNNKPRIFLPYATTELACLTCNKNYNNELVQFTSVIRQLAKPFGSFIHSFICEMAFNASWFAG